MLLTAEQAHTEAQRLVKDAALTGRWRQMVDRLVELRKIAERMDRPISKQTDVRQVYVSEVSRDGRFRGPISCPQVVRVKRRSFLDAGAR